MRRIPFSASVIFINPGRRVCAKRNAAEAKLLAIAGSPPEDSRPRVSGQETISPTLVLNFSVAAVVEVRALRQ
ncbi:Protein of unknown function [Cotesia congregata]|uniref:Uncharacterized protein n=1 Tax=Cotesia congregata TaxID=51543 RepID=A0A8J2MB73_COTCN|nr:Protein of unknown function [Cotesia congregata]